VVHFVLNDLGDATIEFFDLLFSIAVEVADHNRSMSFHFPCTIKAQTAFRGAVSLNASLDNDRVDKRDELVTLPYQNNSLWYANLDCGEASAVLFVGVGGVQHVLNDVVVLSEDERFTFLCQDAGVFDDFSYHVVILSMLLIYFFILTQSSLS
jgi:hypothetical protein